MTYNIRQIISIFTVCSLLVLGGCTQEKEFVNEHNHRDINFKEKSFKEALSLPLFNNAYQKVAKKRGAFRSEDDARTALEEQYGFTIVTDAPVRIITDENGTVFYTILIEREVKEELVFENLMIKVDDEETTAAIFKYTMTEKGTITDDNSYVFSGYSSSEFTDLNVEGKMFFNGSGQTCFDTTAFMCDDQLGYTHSAFGACFQNGTAYMVASTTCMNDGDAGTIPLLNSGSVVVNNPGGGGTDPIVASPIPCKTGNCIAMDTLNPCEDLANHVDPAKGNIKPGVDWLKGILANPLLNRFEFGTNYRKLPDPVTQGYYYDNTNVGNFDVNSVVLSYTSTNVGGGHNHPIDGDSMYSFGDLDQLLDMYETAGPNRQPEVILVLVCRHPNPGLAALGATFTYALKVNDIEKLRAAITAKKNSANFAMYAENDRNEAINKKLAEWYSKSPNKEKTFLQYFGNYGVDVYKANDDLTNWSKLTLQPNATGVLTVNQIPCVN